MRSRSSLAIGIALLAAVSLPVSGTLARFNDSTVSTASIAADTLNAPTGLAAIGGSTVTLTWVPSVDAYATGYAVYRSATSGTGYALVSNVTPGTATTTIDNPGAGTWYYVLQTTFQSWSSANSNQASATTSSCNAPDAQFTVAQNTSHGDHDQTLTYTNTSTSPAGCPITAWLWNFGDGGTSTLMSPPSRTYTGTGLHTLTITLAATNAGGTNTASQTVTFTLR